MENKYNLKNSEKYIKLHYHSVTHFIDMHFLTVKNVTKYLIIIIKKMKHIEKLKLKKRFKKIISILHYMEIKII